jgi:hypothetical protein|tara:strand:- start:224 stop:499 length:276 start_codon:yes stop_codon:yes gene_type:complete
MSSKANSITDFVYLCMGDEKWWTFWELQSHIKNMTGRFYGEPSLSAAIRDLRKDRFRRRYSLPLEGEVVVKQRIPYKKGYQYRLIKGENNV